MTNKKTNFRELLSQLPYEIKDHIFTFDKYRELYKEIVNDAFSFDDLDEFFIDRIQKEYGSSPMVKIMEGGFTFYVNPNCDKTQIFYMMDDDVFFDYFVEPELDNYDEDLEDLDEIEQQIYDNVDMYPPCNNKMMVDIRAPMFRVLKKYLPKSTGEKLTTTWTIESRQKRLGDDFFYFRAFLGNRNRWTI